jgi:hypothetical protein
MGQSVNLRIGGERAVRQQAVEIAGHQIMHARLNPGGNLMARPCGNARRDVGRDVDGQLFGKGERV